METIKFLFMCFGILSFLRLLHIVYNVLSFEHLREQDVNFLQGISEDLNKIEVTTEKLIVFRMLNDSLVSRKKFKRFINKDVPRISATLPMDEDLHQLLVKLHKYDI